jgi:hypothetical protein
MISITLSMMSSENRVTLFGIMLWCSNEDRVCRPSSLPS